MNAMSCFKTVIYKNILLHVYQFSGISSNERCQHADVRRASHSRRNRAPGVALSVPLAVQGQEDGGGQIQGEGFVGREVVH